MRALLLVVLVGCGGSAPAPAAPAPAPAAATTAPPPPVESLEVAVGHQAPSDGTKSNPCDGGEVVAIGDVVGADPCDGGEVQRGVLYGPGELTVDGTGAGGGGSGHGTIGVGRIGTIGSGSGSGSGYGSGGGKSTLRGKHAPTVTPGAPKVSPGIDPAAFKRVMKRHMNRIRYCYEKRLAIDPDAQGRVDLQFVIGPKGDVTSATVKGFDREIESCLIAAIRAIKFPPIKGGGSVIVRYPYNFAPPP